MCHRPFQKFIINLVLNRKIFVVLLGNKLELNGIVKRNPKRTVKRVTWNSPLCHPFQSLNRIAKWIVKRVAKRVIWESSKDYTSHGIFDRFVSISYKLSRS